MRTLRLLLAVSLPVLVLAALTYGLLADAPQPTFDEALARAEAVAAPGFELAVLHEGALGPRLSRAVGPALSDRRVDLGELRGTPVVVNFWASWCDPCREEAPLLERTWQKAHDRGVLFVGLNQQDSLGDARRFLREFDTSYLNVRDPGNEVARRWGLVGLPETFFIDADGNVVAHILGAASAAELREGIEAALSGRPARVDRDGAGPAFKLEPAS
ncbi:MAG: TlpA family protein disulfide reductase [Thermoleophilaceae bacterium]|nr:TlpA family protein disulfide reductase [Thermoleophilaceae bacterium]